MRVFPSGQGLELRSEFTYHLSLAVGGARHDLFLRVRRRLELRKWVYEVVEELSPVVGDRRGV